MVTEKKKSPYTMEEGAPAANILKSHSDTNTRLYSSASVVAVAQKVRFFHKANPRFKFDGFNF